VTLTAGRVTGRATVFASRLADAITSVTVATTPTLITRRRQNAGTIHAVGTEIEVEWRPSARVDLSASWIATRSEFADAAEPELVGNDVPQVPTHQATVRLRATDRWGDVFSGSVRYTSSQYDDDRNVFRLRPFALVDFFAARTLIRGVQVFAAVENAGNVDYDVGRTPQRTVGVPRTFRAGVRLSLP
jgi:outer membrane receptor protein involved in Fe transport